MNRPSWNRFFSVSLFYVIKHILWKTQVIIKWKTEIYIHKGCIKSWNVQQLKYFAAIRNIQYTFASFWRRSQFENSHVKQKFIFLQQCCSSLLRIELWRAFDRKKGSGDHQGSSRIKVTIEWQSKVLGRESIRVEGVWSWNE
jgi:hypothetical protein